MQGDQDPVEAVEADRKSGVGSARPVQDSESGAASALSKLHDILSKYWAVIGGIGMVVSAYVEMRFTLGQHSEELANIPELSDRLDKLGGKLDLLENDLAHLQKWAEKQKRGYSGTDTAPPPAPSASIPGDPLPNPETVKNAQGSPDSVQAALPSVATPREPPTCVHRLTHHKFPCEQATNCNSLKDYKPEFFRRLRDEAGAGDWMLVCDEKQR